MGGRIERNGRTFLQVFEERDIQEVIFALGRVSPIRWPSLPMTTLFSASRFGVAIAGRSGRPTGRRRFATLFAKANELAKKPDLSDFSWADDDGYSWDMGTSSSRDSDEDEAGDAGSRGEFMAE